MIEESFFEVCNQAEPPCGRFVSLYMTVPFYGGPEEGGWWGQDDRLVASQWFPSKRLAKAAVKRVEKLAEEKNKVERVVYGEHCLRTMEWLEQRGLDADYLPEPDGEVRYWVTMEKREGSCESAGTRHYE